MHYCHLNTITVHEKTRKFIRSNFKCSNSSTMLTIFITSLLGLTITTGITNSQETSPASSFTNNAKIIGFQPFESHKVGTQVPVSANEAMDQESRLVLGGDMNNKTSQTQTINKKELARTMRQQFQKFKKSLNQNTKHSDIQKEHQAKFLVMPTTAPIFNKGTTLEDDPTENINNRGIKSRLVIGEVVTKSERRAGEEPSGIKSGLLRFDSHPIPVTFTSLPGFPSLSQPRSSSSNSSISNRGQSTPERSRFSSSTLPNHNAFTPQTTHASFPRVTIDTAFGGSQGSGIRGASFDQIQRNPSNTFIAGRRGSGTRQRPRTRGQGFLARGSMATQGSIQSGIGNFMKVLESRLIGGIMNGGSSSRTNSRSENVPSESTLQQFDPSIVINFLTLVALTQQQRRGGFIIGSGENRSPQGQRNASPVSTTSDIIEGEVRSTADSEFGPLSDGNDPSAGVDPSTIQLPPMLRQTLYSYLLPRLSSLSALVETLPGVPGLDYPIISTVPYTNFYCSNMPWPGFYADTEARCQLWHYCDLEGRQASFLCPNGTIFNQAFFVCDWWYNFDCPSAPYLYSMNERIFTIPETEETAPHRTLTPEILDTIFP
ncbi:uncharacterized protein [Palaemon carinicauda]|uniref:uncharacterized protein n=1 Tax=Palaemon carinicauda TaxID=392227 RepID=UPI0035B5D23B